MCEGPPPPLVNMRARPVTLETICLWPGHKHCPGSRLGHGDYQQRTGIIILGPGILYLLLLLLSITSFSWGPAAD